jgi:precorrin-3B C17-methyltransferase
MALDIALGHLSGSTPVGVVKNAFREGEECIVSTLQALREDDACVDMRSIVIVGGEETEIWRMNGDVRGLITPRGYHKKYVY